MPLVHTEEFTSKLLAARFPELPSGEMKWSKVSNSKLPAYLRVTDAFFAPELRDVIHYHSLFVDMTKHDNHKFNDGNREIGFNKEVFQLAYKFTRLYAARLHIYPDERVTSQKLSDLREMLNRYTNKTDSRPRLAVQASTIQAIRSHTDLAACGHIHGRNRISLKRPSSG